MDQGNNHDIHHSQKTPFANCSLTNASLRVLSFIRDIDNAMMFNKYIIEANLVSYKIEKHVIYDRCFHLIEDVLTMT